jgi:ligand-binding sensor domain-containing protein
MKLFTVNFELMRPALSVLLMLFCQNMCTAQSAPPIGQWREHLPYQQSIAVTVTDQVIWSATPYSVFSIDPTDNSIERVSRISGLTETGIRTIGTDAARKKLIIVYSNGSVDIVSGADVHNVPDIKLTPLISDKTINQVYASNGNTWLAGNEAIYLLDVTRNEIRDTYIIGDTGSKTATTTLAVYRNILYAATAAGIKYATLNGPNLSDFRSWQRDTLNGLPAVVPAQVFSAGDQLLCLAGDTIYRRDTPAWSPFYGDGWNIRSVDADAGKYILHEARGAAARIVVLNATGTVDKIIQHTLIKQPRGGIIKNDEVWISDSITGLVRVSGNTAQQFNPASPASLTTGPLESVGQKMAVVSGGPGKTWEPAAKPGVIALFENNAWINFTSASLPALDTFPDLVAVAIDPVDQSIWAGSFGGGLLHLGKDNALTVYKQRSFLQETYFTPGSYRVGGLAFDAESNLWIANYGADRNLVVRKKDGSWQSFKVPYPLIESALTQIVIDDINQKWIISPRGNGLIVFNHGESIGNTADDQWKWYRSGAGSGNLPDNNVYCLARDKDGFIWLGTRQGIAVIRCPQDALTPAGCEAIRPIVQQDNFAGYLFRDEEVQAIAVDGANRKWVGTGNGLWLLSADGEKIIYRFSVANSPLASNDIRYLSIEPVTGEVFVSTAMGISSFRGTATEAPASQGKIVVFPNPVPPSYAGTIAIRGLANNALVKITELNGNLVFQTRALGGQAIWNGRDYKGRQISTGVYLVLITDDHNKDELATKIVYIKK